MEYIPTLLQAALTPITLTACYLAMRVWCAQQRMPKTHLAVLFGLAMWLTLMTAPQHTAGIVAMDMRGTVLSLAVLFGGAFPALTTLLIGVLTRAWLGGGGMPAGIAVLVVIYAGLQIMVSCFPKYFPLEGLVSRQALTAAAGLASFAQYGSLVLTGHLSDMVIVDIGMLLTQFLVTVLTGSLLIGAQLRSELRESLVKEKELAHFRMTRDGETGLLNQAGLTLALDRALHSLHDVATNEGQLAVVTIGLRRLQQIDEVLGPHAANSLLRAIVRRLEIVTGQLPLARLDDETFCVLVEDFKNQQLSSLTEEMLIAFRRPIFVDNIDIYISANIGVSLHSPDGADAKTRLTHSIQALRNAGRAGEYSIEYFNLNILSRASKQIKLEFAMRVALNRSDEFYLEYQPKVQLATEALSGMEALCRWKSSEFGVIHPAEFIPIAENSNLIHKLGAWTLEETCKQISTWQQQGWLVPIISVNLSANQLLDHHFPKWALDCVHQHGHSPSAIEFELTESAVMTDPKQAKAILSRLREYGFKLALDDFGTGYSNLAYLKALRFDCLKVDKSFVKDIEHDSDSRALCGGIFSLGRSLGLTMLAEGVETKGQLKILNNLGYQLGQGFYFASALPPEEVASRWLTSLRVSSPAEK